MQATFDLSYDAPDAALRIAGELDLAFQGQLRNHLADLLDYTGAVRLDLADLTFVDCTCLHTIELLRQELAASGRGFEIVAASMPFHLVAHLAQYDELLASVSGARVTPLRHARSRRTTTPRSNARTSTTSAGSTS
jgi:anti-anti-sigma regulatory factor